MLNLTHRKSLRTLLIVSLSINWTRSNHIRSQNYWNCVHIKHVLAFKFSDAGLFLYGGNEGDCPYAPWSLPWSPSNAPVEVYNFLIGYPSPRRKCLGALALSKTWPTFLHNDWANWVRGAGSLKACKEQYTREQVPNITILWPVR